MQFLDMSSKSQADIISIALIVIIALSLAGTAYLWGIPLIQKRQHTIMVERVQSFFDRENVNSITSKIENIARKGGEDVFVSTEEGLWVLYPYDHPSPENNSIQFTIFSKVSNIAVGTEKDISFTSGATCPPSSGTLGIASASVVCGRADVFSDGYNITYKLYFRELEESPKKGYKINLVKYSPTSPPSSSGKTVRISRGEISTITQDGKTLIITEIKILLE